jgi:hypothetical protein
MQTFPRNSSRIRAKKTPSLSKVGSKRSHNYNIRILETAQEVCSKSPLIASRELEQNNKRNA